MQSEINISLGDKAPAIYFADLSAACESGQAAYGGITDPTALEETFVQHCVPTETEFLSLESYDRFLHERRKLMAQKIQKYYFEL